MPINATFKFAFSNIDFTKNAVVVFPFVPVIPIRHRSRWVAIKF